MISNPFKTISRIFWVLLLVATFVPMRSFAAEPTDLGKITIEVTDQNGVNMNGDWYLHQGTTDKGMVLRNGTKGEVFNFTAGVYFLEVRNLKVYPFYKVFSRNPQTLTIGSAIRFEVQYFKTEEQLANAKDAPVVVDPAVLEVVPALDVPVDTAPVAPIVSAPVVPKANPHIKLNIVRPASVDPWISDNSSADTQEYSLAVTGPEGLLGALSLFSLVSGLWIVKRKND